METWQGHWIKWASEINNRLRINEAAELSSVSSSSASHLMHCLLCSPAHHTSSPIDAESFCKSILNPRREHLMDNELGHSVTEATKAKFHSPEAWWFPDGILGSSQPKQKSREMAGIWQEKYLTCFHPPVLWLFGHCYCLQRTKKGLKPFQSAVIFYRD